MVIKEYITRNPMGITKIITNNIFYGNKFSKLLKTSQLLENKIS